MRSKHPKPRELKSKRLSTFGYESNGMVFIVSVRTPCLKCTAQEIKISENFYKEGQAWATNK